MPSTRVGDAVRVEAAVREAYAVGADHRVEDLCCPVDYDPRYLEAIPDEHDPGVSGLGIARARSLRTSRQELAEHRDFGSWCRGVRRPARDADQHTRGFHLYLGRMAQRFWSMSRHRCDRVHAVSRSRPDFDAYSLPTEAGDYFEYADRIGGRIRPGRHR